MRPMDWMRIVIVLVLLGIIGSLASAFVFLVKDKGTTDRTVRALTIRVGLSVALFVVLIAARYFGFITPSHPI